MNHQNRLTVYHSLVNLIVIAALLAANLAVNLAMPQSVRAEGPLGSALVWGWTGYGPTSATQISSTPVQVVELNNVVAIDGTRSHTLMVKSDSTVWAFGNNTYWQLGDGTTNSSTIPVQVKGPGGVGYLSGITAVATGWYHNLALKSDGTVWAWGYNSDGQLGIAVRDSGSSTPVQVKAPAGAGFLTDVVAIAAERFWSLALKSDGTVWAWGANYEAGVGDNTTGTRSRPVQVVGPSGVGFLTDVTAIAAGDTLAIARKSDGSVWTWGSNYYGQAGDGTMATTGANRRKLAPVQVKGPGGIGFLGDVVAVGTGQYHALAVKSDGTVWAWGDDTAGQLGNGTNPASTTPVQVLGPGGTGFLTGITAVNGANAVQNLEYAHSVALAQDGSVWTWGWNKYGQLGDGTTTLRDTPVKVVGIGGVGYLGGATMAVASHNATLAVAPVPDTTPPTLTAQRTPASNANGWNNGPVTVSFTCVDNPGGSGVKSVSDPTTLTSDGAGQSVTGTCTDNAGNSATLTVDQINIDQVAPLLSGAPAAPPNAAGWYNGDVSVTWTCSDVLSDIDGACPADSVLGGEGQGLAASASVNDKAGNATTATSAPPVNIDRTAPNTGIAAPGGWNNQDVNVILEPHDALSGVSATYYILDDGAQQNGTALAIQSEGVHTLVYWSVDNAGNVEAVHTAEIKIDLTSPTINHTQAPPANGNGWNNTGVTVTFICADDLSGIASCTPPQTVSSEGRDQSVLGEAVDNAGNTATDPAAVSIDLTPPVITAAPGSAPNPAGWYKDDVTVSFGCNDALSGIDVCPAAVILGEGADQAASGTATDAAGNSATASVSGINVDKTAPLLNGAALTTPNAAGWYQGDVTVRWTCSDALSGIAGACPADSVITQEGADLEATASVADLAGNVSTASVSASIDRTPPLLSYSAHAGGQPYAPGTWTNQDVTVEFACTDSLSGVNSLTGPVTLTGEGANQSVHGACSDAAGNTSDLTVDGINIDKTAPVMANWPGAINAEAPGPDGVAVTYTEPTVTDNLDPVPTLTCSPASGSIFPVGQTTVVCTASDAASNTGSGSFSITVTFVPPSVAIVKSVDVANVAGARRRVQLHARDHQHERGADPDHRSQGRSVPSSRRPRWRVA